MKKIMFLLALAACGDDPVNYSSPVGIELKVKSGEVVNNAISPDKSITTESGNPYGAFVTEARNRIGHDPGAIELEALRLTLGAQSTNLTNLNEVMAGDCVVQFLMNDTNNTYVAGHFMDPAGAGPVEGTVSFEWAQVGETDIAKFIGGSFKVVLTAPSAAGYATKGAEAVLQLTFTFKAFE